jgi:hypothetical protein
MGYVAEAKPSVGRTMVTLDTAKPATVSSEPTLNFEQLGGPLHRTGKDQPSLDAPSVGTRRHRRAESSEDYPDIVAILNARWRVIACRDNIQWILQYRNRAETVARDG